MKEILCGAMAAVMTVSLAGCAKSESDTTATAGSSYTGTVTAVSAVSLTVETESDGEVTVTVGSYSTNVDTSGAAVADSWDDYAVDKA